MSGKRDLRSDLRESDDCPAWSNTESAAGRSKEKEKFALRPAGLEPATYWFEASHSIQLSYGREIAFVFDRPALDVTGNDAL
jgi:hypothetical protein